MFIFAYLNRRFGKGFPKSLEIDSLGIHTRLDTDGDMEYKYGNKTYDLRELPPSLWSRIGEEEVVAALHAYLDAYTADKEVIDEYDTYDSACPTDPVAVAAYWIKIGQLRRTATKSRILRKLMWFALLDVLDESYGYTSTDEEDFDE